MPVDEHRMCGLWPADLWLVGVSWQIVTDMRTLRSLAEFLLHLDAVTFLSYLDTLRATEGTRSLWLFHTAAHTIFEQATPVLQVLPVPTDMPQFER